MKEPSYICALLDNAAALGNSARIWAYSERWGNHARNTVGERKRLWERASGAAYRRWRAVRYRLEGKIAQAARNEHLSELHLQAMGMSALELQEQRHTYYGFFDETDE